MPASWCRQGGRASGTGHRTVIPLSLGSTTIRPVEDAKISFIREPVAISTTSCPRMSVKCIARDVGLAPPPMNRPVIVQCERGSPLRVGENAQHCQTNGQCPSSHECKVDHGVCCPSKHKFLYFSQRCASGRWGMTRAETGRRLFHVLEACKLPEGS